MTISWDTNTWYPADQTPIPMRTKVEGLSVDGKTIILGKCMKIGNTLTDANGMRHPITHWRRVDP